MFDSRCASGIIFMGTISDKAWLLCSSRGGSTPTESATQTPGEEATGHGIQCDTLPFWWSCPLNLHCPKGNSGFDSLPTRPQAGAVQFAW